MEQIIDKNNKMNLSTAETEAEIACRAGVVLASECSVFVNENYGGL